MEKLKFSHANQNVKNCHYLEKSLSFTHKVKQEIALVPLEPHKLCNSDNCDPNNGCL